MTFQERARTPELPNSATQKSLQWARGGHSWVLFPPWHFISWVWVAPHKKKDLHPSSIYHPQTLTDLARGTVIQYTEGGLKIVDVVAKLPPLCLYTLTASKQPLMTLENGLCYWNCVSTHQGHEAFPGQGRQWGQKKEKSGQKPDCTDSYWTKPLLPTLCITALKTNESRRQVERAEQHKLSSITVPQDTIKWIEKSSNIQTVLLPLSAISMFVLG